MGAAPSTMFRFHVPVEGFEKTLPNGKTSLRIGGLVSTAGRDKQDERVLQDGLDFSDFESSGWFNDNHGKGVTDVVGLPTAAVKRVRAGEKLPNGDVAKKAGWWAEGILVGSKGKEVHQIAKDLEGTGRQLGFSIEGSVVERSDKDRRDILRATVRNIAITHCPVNAETELKVLSKALFAGSAITNPGTASGAGGAGFALRSESLDPEIKILTFGGRKKKPKKTDRARHLNEVDGVETLKSRYPRLTTAQARLIYQRAAQERAR